MTRTGLIAGLMLLAPLIYERHGDSWGSAHVSANLGHAAPVGSWADRQNAALGRQLAVNLETYHQGAVQWATANPTAAGEIADTAILGALPGRYVRLGRWRSWSDPATGIVVTWQDPPAGSPAIREPVSPLRLEAELLRASGYSMASGFGISAAGGGLAAISAAGDDLRVDLPASLSPEIPQGAPVRFTYLRP